MKKILIIFLGILLVIPFIKIEDVSASGTYNFNRTLEITFNDISNTNTTTSGIVTTTPFREISIGGGGFVLYESDGFSYTTQRDVYTLDPTHVYYLAIVEDIAYNVGDIYNDRIDLYYEDGSTQRLTLDDSTAPVYESVFTPVSSDNFNMVLETAPTNFGNFRLERIVLVDLTESYLSGNEPTLEYLQNKDFYNNFENSFFENINVWDSDPDILELNTDRTFNNIIENGDFDDFSAWSVSGESYISNNKGNVYTSTGAYSALYQTNLLDLDKYYYVQLDATVLAPALNILNSYVISETQVYRDIYFSSTTNFTMKRQSGSTINHILVDNIMIFDLEKTYSKGNEADENTIVNILSNAPYYFESYSFDSTSYYTLEDDTNFYQYYNDIESNRAKVDFTLTDTLLQNPTEPHIYITKNDLDGNYLGDLLETKVSVTGQNSDGFNYYDFDYNLPHPSGNEDGYTYTVYNGVGGEIITAGYVFNEVSDSFKTTYSNVRNNNYAIGINNSVYVDIADSYQFEDDNHTEYIFNSNKNAIVHYRVNKGLYDTDVLDIVMNMENNINQVVLPLNDIHDGFNDLENSTSILDGYFYMSYNNGVPDFLDALNSSIVYSKNVSNAYTTYNTYLTETFNTGAIPDYSGFYTYYIGYDTGSDYDVMAIGETPIYASENNILYDALLLDETVNLGGYVNFKVDKNDENIDYVYDDQYIQDYNSGNIYEDSLSTFNSTYTVTYKLLNGSEGVNYLVYYNLRNNDPYINGADVHAYDLRFQDVYTVHIPDTLEDRTNGLLDELGMESTIGRFLFVTIILVVGTLFMVVQSFNKFIILMVDLGIIALFVIIGLIPLYIPLLLILLLFFLTLMVIRFK